MTPESQLAYLESERKKIWESLVEMKSQLEALRTETPQEAIGAGRKTSEYRNRAKEALEEIQEIQATITAQCKEASSKHGTIAGVVSLLEKAAEKAATAEEITKSVLQKTATSQTEIDKLATTAEECLEWLEENKKAITEASEHQSRIVEIRKKVEILLQNATDQEAEITGLHNEVFGFEVEDSGESIKKVEGLKTKLEKAYTELSVKLDSLGAEIDKQITSSESVCDELHKTWQTRHEEIQKRIVKLLPAALTAGLSAAYSDKKKEEMIEGEKLQKNFYWAIVGMIAVSFIPFAVSIKSMFDGLPLETTLIRIPRLVLAILPLYIPILWVAYSANRRANLSKRLVEEYSHKEVQAKTYEGLSQQINELKGELSEDLRVKLLYNILEISAENPGKLISDYNKADHPLLDALDKSVKLTNAVEKLGRLPGFSKIAVQMQKKADKIVSIEKEKATAGLSTVN